MKALALALLLALPATAQEPDLPGETGLAVGRALTRLFLGGKIDALWAHLTPVDRGEPTRGETLVPHVAGER